MFLSDWYSRKKKLTCLPGQDGKVTSDKKIIYISRQGYKGWNRDYYSHSSATFETIDKFLIVFVRLILGKVGVDGFTEPRRESDIRYEFELKVLLKGLRCKYRFSDLSLIELLSNN